MEKETIPKFATVIVCMVVAVTVIMTALVPIISDQTTTTELAPADGAYGYMRYNPNPETESYAYVWINPQSDPAGFKVQWGMPATLNHTVLLSDLPDGKMILYADSHLIIYSEDGKYHYYSPDGSVPTYTEGDTVSVPSLPVESTFNGIVKVNKISSGIRYTASTNEQVTVSDLPAYYYVSDPTGDYANFVGDNPPAMDTPSVSVAGMYIGPKMVERTVPNDPFTGSVVLTIIPIIMLVSLVMLCIREFMKKQE